MTATAAFETPLTRVLHHMLVCAALPFLFMAVFAACATIDIPAADTGVTVDQPVRPHHPHAAAHN